MTTSASFPSATARQTGSWNGRKEAWPKTRERSSLSEPSGEASREARGAASKRSKEEESSGMRRADDLAPAAPSDTLSSSPSFRREVFHAAACRVGPSPLVRLALRRLVRQRAEGR